MTEKTGQPSTPGARVRLKCSGLWGGIRDRAQEITAGKLVASLYASSCDGGKGGDIYYFGVCRGEKITRVAIADVVGHGETVSEVSRYVYDTMKAHMCDIDSRTILADINQLVARRGLEAMTTAAIVAYYSEAGLACISYAGHPPALIKRRSDRTWSFATQSEAKPEGFGHPSDIPLAVASGAHFRQFETPMSPGDRIVVYTDGVTEARSPEGSLFGTDRLKEVLDECAESDLSSLKSHVLRALRAHSKDKLDHDDLTLIAMEIA